MSASVPISVTSCLKSEPDSLQCSLEVFRITDEKYGGFDIVCLPQFFEKDFGESGSRGRKQLQIENFVRLRIRDSVQSELLVVDSDHCSLTATDSMIRH